MSNFNYMDPLVYTPAYSPTRPGPEKLLYYAGGNDKSVTRIVGCNEDANLEEHTLEGFANIQTTLNEVEQSDPRNPTEFYVRVRNPWGLEQVLAMDGLKNLKGFVLPKVTLENFGVYAETICSMPGDFTIMPILESRKILDDSYMHDLCDALMEPVWNERISCVRTGLKDLMAELGLTRDFEKPIYSNNTIGPLIGQINREFNGRGKFPVTAPVYWSNDKAHLPMFDADVSAEVDAGNFGKTTVFPSYAKRTRQLYRVSEEQYNWALDVLKPSAPAVSKNSRGIMIEKAPDRKTAPLIIARAIRYGIQHQDGAVSFAEEEAA